MIWICTPILEFFTDLSSLSLYQSNGESSSGPSVKTEYGSPPGVPVGPFDGGTPQTIQHFPPRSGSVPSSGTVSDPFTRPIMSASAPGPTAIMQGKLSNSKLPIFSCRQEIS